MAAMGETYICRTQTTAMLLDSNGVVYKADQGKLIDYVVDMDSGFRALTEDTPYWGECRKSGISIICLTEIGGDFGYLTIDLESLEFTRSSHYKALNLIVSSDVGKCIEI